MIFITYFETFFAKHKFSSSYCSLGNCTSGWSEGLRRQRSQHKNTDIFFSFHSRWLFSSLSFSYAALVRWLRVVCLNFFFTDFVVLSSALFFGSVTSTLFFGVFVFLPNFAIHLFPHTDLNNAKKKTYRAKERKKSKTEKIVLETEKSTSIKHSFAFFIQSSVCTFHSLHANVERRRRRLELLLPFLEWSSAFRWWESPSRDTDHRRLMSSIDWNLPKNKLYTFFDSLSWFGWRRLLFAY